MTLPVQTQARAAPAAAGVVPPIGNDADTKLLIQPYAADPDGSDTIYDVSVGGYHATERKHTNVKIVNDADFPNGKAIELLSGGGSVGLATVLHHPNDEDWQFGLDDFDIELFAKFNSHNAFMGIMGYRGAATDPWQIDWDGSGNLRVISGGTTASWAWTPNVSTPPSPIYHLKLQRNTGQLSFYVDGVQQGAAQAFNVNIGAISQPLSIGNIRGDDATYYPIDGWLGGIRITKGATRPITVPSAPYGPVPAQVGNDANTVWLVQCDGPSGSTAFEDKSLGSTPAGGHVITAGGNAAVNTSAMSGPKNQTCRVSSGGDISSPDHDDFEFAAGPFTIEFEAEFATVATAMLFRKITALNNNQAWGGQYASNQFFFYLHDTTNGHREFTWPWTPQVGVRQHIAVVRDGDDINLFLDGVSQGQQALGAVSVTPTTSPVVFGSQTTNFAGNFDGHYDNIRITKGVAQYPGEIAFTPNLYPFGPDAR